MTAKDFWFESTVAVIGAGSWGTVLANLLARNCREVRLWCRDEEQTRAMTTTRVNARYLPEMILDPKIRIFSDFERIFETHVGAVIWALPSYACRERMREAARFFRGDEFLFHATKGVEEKTLKRISEILKEEIPCARIGVISGPNLAIEIARGDPSATVIASQYDEVTETGVTLLANEMFRVYSSYDVIGVEWSGALKNILSVAGGALEALKMGGNARAMLITRGLAEMARFGVAMGGQEHTFMGLAGLGDLLATSSSPLSRNFRTGYQRAQGEKLENILKSLGGVAEGVRMAAIVRAAAQEHKVIMPLSESVQRFLEGSVDIQDGIRSLMARPMGREY